MKNSMRMVIAGLLAGAASVASAVPIVPTEAFSAGTLFNTTGLSSFTTGGDDMDGMKVTVTYGDDTTATATWATTGVDAGAASGADWSLSMNDATSFAAFWILDYSALTNRTGIKSITIDARLGDTVFDVTLDPVQTPDSARGGSVGNNANGSTVDGPAGTAVHATYANRVLENNVFYGDLYTTLTLDFASPLTAGSPFTFTSDTDNVSLPGDITPVPAPEPTSLALLGLGMVALLRARRRSARV